MIITINETELQGIVNYLQEQPAKFSNPLLNFFDSKVREQKKEENTPTQEQINNINVVADEVTTDKPPKNSNDRKSKKNG